MRGYRENFAAYLDVRDRQELTRPTRERREEACREYDFSLDSIFTCYMSCSSREANTDF